MMDEHWYIAVKRVEAIPPDLEKKLTSLGVTILKGDVYIHAHFFIPENVYSEAEDFFKEGGYTLSKGHPPVCSIGAKPKFEVFEKMVPILEGRETQFLAKMAEHGIMMSGGAGKPHVHLSIPPEKRNEVLELLKANKYFPKNYSC